MTIPSTDCDIHDILPIELKHTLEVAVQVEMELEMLRFRLVTAIEAETTSLAYGTFSTV